MQLCSAIKEQPSSHASPESSDKMRAESCPDGQTAAIRPIFNQEFEQFLFRITSTKEQVDALITASASPEILSEAALAAMWNILFDTLIKENGGKERLELVNMIKGLYSALTDRRALELREGNSEKQTLDASKLKEIETKLNLL